MDDIRADLAVIGCGPAGSRAAMDAAAYGLDVACFEESLPGGTCLNRGCVPAKAMIKTASECLAAMRLRKGATPPPADFAPYWAEARARAAEASARLLRGLEFSLKKSGVRMFGASARILGPGRLEAEFPGGGKCAVYAKKILIASGASPRRIPGVSISDPRVVTGSGALKLESIPRRAIALGAGAVGLEFAWLWNALGAEVRVAEAAKSALPSADSELSRSLARALRREGVEILTGLRAEKCEAGEGGVSVRCSSEGGEKSFEADAVLVSAGLELRPDSIFAPGFSVETDCGFIKTSPGMETSADGIYAAGDVAGPPALAHAAAAEGAIAAAAIAGREPPRPAPCPACLYCEPQAAWIGMTEDAARAELAPGSWASSKASYVSNAKACCDSASEGFVKVIYDSSSGEIAGAHILGADASELIGIFCVAMQNRLTVRDISRTVFPHPALSELAAAVCSTRQF